MVTSTVKTNMILWIVACTVILTAGQALAHSTADRVKVELKEDRPAIDDVAYFVESYVHRLLYSDNTPATENRFVVKEFIAVEQKDDAALVRFITLDKKGNKSFEDSMRIQRGSGGIWRHQPKDGGEPVDIYTYVTKTRYYWETSWKRIAIILGVLSCLSPVALWHVKREERKAQARAVRQAQATSNA